MATEVFRMLDIAGCATCGAEWFGRMGEPAARDHAAKTGHQVILSVTVRETINVVPITAQPNYSPQAAMSSNDRARSVAAASRRAAVAEAPLRDRVKA